MPSPFMVSALARERNHQRQVQVVAGYRRASPLDLLALEQWLLERSLEHDNPMLLFEMTCQYLQHNKIIRIGATRLEKMVATARQQAQEAIYQALQPLLKQEQRQFLDDLLEVDDELGCSPEQLCSSRVGSSRVGN